MLLKSELVNSVDKAWWPISLMPLALCVVLVLPWLDPFAIGPTPAVLPWLVSVTCAAVVLLARSRITGQTVSTSWFLAAWLSAYIGLLQYFGQTQGLGPWVHTTALGEAFANLRQRNQFATLTSIGLQALLWWAAQHQTVVARSAQAARPALWFLGVGAILLALGNAASGSRTGFVQWVLVFGLAFVWAGPDHRRVPLVAAFALAVYVFAALALPWVLNAVAGVQSGGLLGRFDEEAGCGSRRVLWSNVLHLIAQKPWLGWGWGNLDFAHFTTLYPGERFCDILDNAHNLPLHLAVELGVPVAVVLCVLCVWLIWRNRPWAESDPTRQMAWSVLAVIGVHSMLEYPLWYGPFQLAVALCIWMLWPTRQTAADLDKTQAVAHRYTAWSATILIAFCAYAAWDYWRISQIYLPPSARNAAYRDDTLAKIQGSWLFRDQVRFAELTTTVLTPENAAHVNALAKDMLHFSPESRVVEKLIESAVMLSDDAQALFYLERFKAAFPQQHARWSAKLKAPQPGN
jgi:O-antigen ligase